MVLVVIHHRHTRCLRLVLTDSHFEEEITAWSHYRCVDRFPLNRVIPMVFTDRSSMSQRGIVQQENHIAIYKQHLLTVEDRRNIYGRANLAYHPGFAVYNTMMYFKSRLMTKVQNVERRRLEHCCCRLADEAEKPIPRNRK